MEDVVVRPARPGDGADLARALTDAARHYVELDPDAFQVPDPDGLAEWFEGLLRRRRSDDEVWLVAEVGGRVVGDVHAHLERPVEDAARQVLRDLGRVCLAVDALGVAAAYRRRGAGARLMDAVERWGRDRGAERAVLSTYVHSSLSVPFYERRMGYRRRSIVFVKRLGPT
jgi:GNAT superfamily N-acetyltransferase